MTRIELCDCDGWPIHQPCELHSVPIHDVPPGSAPAGGDPATNFALVQEVWTEAEIRAAFFATFGLTEHSPKGYDRLLAALRQRRETP